MRGKTRQLRDRFEREAGWKLDVQDYLLTEHAICFRDELDYSEFVDWCMEEGVDIDPQKGHGMHLVSIL